MSRAAFSAVALLGLVLWSIGAPARAEHGNRIAAHGDIVRDQHQRDATDEHHPPAGTAPSRYFRQPVAAERRAAAAEQREDANLKAQLRIADAAEGQQGSAFWQTVISGIGMVVAIGVAVMVFRTFQETQRTARASIDAAVAAQRSADASEAALALSRAATRMQLRPTVAYAAGRLTGGANPASWNQVEIQVTNYGATTAKNVRLNVASKVSAWPPQPLPPLEPAAHWSPAADMPSGHPSRLTVGMPPIDDVVRGAIFQSLAALIVTLRIEYAGEDGATYDAVTTLVCMGSESLEGRLRTFDPQQA